MELQQLDASDSRFLVFRREALNTVWRALQATHGALFAYEFFEEYECEIERAAQRLGERGRMDHRDAVGWCWHLARN